MTFTDIFIKRPVFASVLSLLILLFGLVALHKLPLRQFPQMEQAVIEVTTSYPGANAELVQSFITTTIQRAIADADGIDFLTAESKTAQSSVEAHLKLGVDADRVFTNVMAKVAQVRGELPQGSEAPIIKKSTGDEIAYLYLSFTSERMTNQQITDYLWRVVEPKLATISGVAQAQILGAADFALRIWLDPAKMTALGIAAGQVLQALQANHYNAAAGDLDGQYVIKQIRADTDVHDVANFKALVIDHRGDTLIRLQDVARVELGAKSYKFNVSFNGKPAMFIGVSTTPGANPLDVVRAIKQELPNIERDFPPDLHATIAYDRTAYISSALDGVKHTLIEASCIVFLVIFLFLGNLRTVLIPLVTIPLSLIGVCTVLYALGYSLNLLTLLAMVLAIGLVVDDAIVVVENIYRHIEQGKSGVQAALQGAREIVFPVIGMTLTLAAVYAPITLSGGLTGALFTEFALTLAATVIISGFIALTLSPMMCAKILTYELAHRPLAQKIDHVFSRLRGNYQRYLHAALDRRGLVLALALGTVLLSVWLYQHSQQELAPQEDDKFIGAFVRAPEHANAHYLNHFTKMLAPIYAKVAEGENYFLFNSSDTNAFAGLILKPWDKRKRTPLMILPELQQALNKVAGVSAFAMTFPSLPGENGRPVGFVLTSTQNHLLLKQAADALQERAGKSGLFTFLDSDTSFTVPQMELLVDRNKAAQLGISMQAISQTLALMLNGHYVGRFALQGYSYDIIPQLPKEQHLTASQLQQIPIKTASGAMIPLATVVRIGESVQPDNLKQFQQLNAITLQGGLMPGVTTGQAIAYLKQQAKQLFPQEVGYDFKGQMRRFLTESDTLGMLFLLACLVIFLVLAAQFESYTDPLIILISVPLSICGALIPLALGAGSLNIYTQIGLLTLIGLITKAGILMVDFANKLRDEQQYSLRAAIEAAAALRLRPILMTTAAMVVGVLPLVFADGAGAESRHQLGLVIACGMSIGTLLTLFVLPTFYLLLARRQRG